MLTRLIQRTNRDPDAAIEYEHEYREAEYEYEGHRRGKAWRINGWTEAGHAFYNS